MPTDQPLRTQLIALLKGGQAHATFDDAVKAFPTKLRAAVPHGLPYSAWQLVEHIRITQRDILDFSLNQSLPDNRRAGQRATNPRYPKASALGRPKAYKPLKWPAAYWPKSPTPPTARAWPESLRQIRRDRAAFLKLLRTASPTALNTPFPWATDPNQTLLREALLLADHTAYHLGELIVLRRLLGTWK